MRFLGVDEQVKIRMFLETFRENNEKYRKRLELGDIAEGTVLRWERCVVYLKEYLKSHKKVEDIPLRDVTLPLIDDFELWLRTVKECGHNCAIRYISTIRKIFRDAVNYKWIDRDPFYGKTYSKKKTNREHLTEAELNAVMSLDLKLLPRLEAVRDVFVFCCFTGLSYCELYNLSEDNIRTYFDDHEWIHISRQKTTVLSEVQLLDIPKIIYEKYKGIGEGGKIFPVPKYSTILGNIKKIMKLCGIDKEVTWHIGRHTMATTVCLSNNMPIETVSSILGHKNIRTTQIYAKITKEKVKRDMSALASQLNSIEEFAGVAI